MPEIKLFCDPQPGYFYFKNEIINHVQKNEKNWLSILPVNRAVRQLSRELIAHAPNKILAAAPVYTFDGLLLRLYRELPEQKSLLGADILNLLVEEILKNNSARFSYFPASMIRQPSLLSKISAAIDELRRFGYSAADIKKQTAEELELPLSKLDDFEIILQELEKILGNRFIDTPRALCEAAAKITPELIRRQWPDLQNIYISGYGLFTPAMFTFIEKAGSFFNLKIKLDYSTQNPELFEHTFPAFERLQSMGAAIAEPEKIPALASKLFNRNRRAGTFDAANRFQLYHCDDRSMEVTQIARQILRIYQEKNAPLQRIAITFSNMEKYVPFIRRIFTEYGIPFNLSTGFALKQSPLINTLLNALHITIKRFEYNQIFNLHNSPFIGVNKKSSSAQKLTFSKIYKELTTNRVRYLLPGWQKQLTETMAKSGRQVNENLQKEMDQLSLFLKPFHAFSLQPRSAGKLHSDYLNLLKDCEALDWYTDANASLTERQREREFRAYNRFMKLLEQFAWSMQTLFEEQPIDPEIWLQHLRAAVARSNYNLTEWPLNVVQIMPRLEIQAMNYDYLFIGGLVDGDFPRQSATDIFFNDVSRAKMGLVAGEDLLSQDRFMFYSLLESAAKKVYLTTPRYEGEKALVPSTFLDDLQETCKISIVHTDDNSLISLNQLWQQFGFAIQKMDNTFIRNSLPVIHNHVTDNVFYELMRKIAGQHQRLTFQSDPGELEGVLSAFPQIKNELAERYNDFQWSITQLEEYAYCPIRYFFKRIMRLEEWPEFEEEVSPLERGKAVHHLLFRFYSQLREMKQTAFPNRHLDLLKEMASEELDHFPFEGFFWKIEKIRYFGYEDKPGLLETFLNIEESEIDQSGFIPAYFEFCFGKRYDDEVDPASSDDLLVLQNEAGETIRLNGKIDRIDINPKTKEAIVFDYKTGSLAGKNATMIARGTSFQLPVYILATEQLLDNQLKIIAGGYYQVKDSENCKRAPAMADVEKYTFYQGTKPRFLLPNNFVKIGDNPVSFDQLVSHSKETALQKQIELKQASFRHTQYPEENECSKFCDFRRVCQKHVAKLKFRREL
ncbi:MAG: exodeoxyribonuclease V subunit gamma [Calditrichaeota bacterium]|nr:exodeoxyribonuclease V subunit gamma [Calditrichota bacterium]